MPRAGVEDDGSAVTMDLVKIREEVDNEGVKISEESPVEEFALKIRAQYKSTMSTFMEVHNM